MKETLIDIREVEFKDYFNSKLKKTNFEYLKTTFNKSDNKGKDTFSFLTEVKHNNDIETITLRCYTYEEEVFEKKAFIDKISIQAIFQNKSNADKRISDVICLTEFNYDLNSFLKHIRKLNKKVNNDKSK